MKIIDSTTLSETLAICYTESQLTDCWHCFVKVCCTT